MALLKKRRPPEVHVKKKYTRMAANYDDHWGEYGRRTIRRAINRLNLTGATRLLDIGCGTGILTEELARSHPNIKVVGADVSMDMLEVAHSKFNGEARLAGASASCLPFADATFDVAVTCSSFHYWRNPERALDEIARVVKPGGYILISDWCCDYFQFGVMEFFYRIFRRSHYKLYKLEECRDMLRRTGYEGVNVEKYKVGWFWGMMTATGRVPVNGNGHGNGNGNGNGNGRNGRHSGNGNGQNH